MLVVGHLPEELDVRESARDQHDVARAVTENAVSDVNVAALRVFDLSFHGIPSRRRLSRHYRKRHRKGKAIGRCFGMARPVMPNYGDRLAATPASGRNGPPSRNV